jgi:AcrR family transcriptional regulator
MFTSYTFVVYDVNIWTYTVFMARAKIAAADTGSLRDRIIAAASSVFANEGYESLSMRRVALEAGCSQMAMYRHFANKEALIEHICTQAYRQFTAKVQREIDSAEDAWGQLRKLISALIRFAINFPNHYALIFLIRHENPEVSAERERLGQEFIAGMQGIVRELLPEDMSVEDADGRLRQMLSCLHGTAALLIAHPKAYGLTRQRAIEDAEATFESILGLRGRR